MEQQLREYLRETVREGGKKASRRNDLLAGRAPGEEKYAQRATRIVGEFNKPVTARRDTNHSRSGGGRTVHFTRSKEDSWRQTNKP